MNILNSMKNRRSIYGLSKELPVSQEEVISTIESAVELVPDAFNMKSARVVIVLNDKQNELWDSIFNVFGGKVPREKIDSFKSGAGTVLYFYDKNVVDDMQEKFPSYAENFPIWSNQANGMLQFGIWTALRELGVGANIQHYNPVIDDKVKELFDIPENYVLVAEMPFGGITSEPDEKEREVISKRVKVVK